MKKVVSLACAMVFLLLSILTGCNTTATTPEVISKEAFAAPIQCDWKGSTITVNPPIYPGIGFDDIYSYKDFYKFSDDAVTVCIKDGTASKYILLSKAGEIIDDNYIAPAVTDEAPLPTEDAVRGGEDMFFYPKQTATGNCTYGLMDSNGNMLTDFIYEVTTPFLNGYAGVVLADSENPYAVIDKQGAVIGTLPESGVVRGNGVAVVQTGKPGAYTQQLYSVTGELLNDTKFDAIGYFYNGLALVEKDRKIGLIDEEGTLLLEPTIAYDRISYSETERAFYPVYMNEDAFILPIDGEMAVMTISR